ncbi:MULTISPECIES: hypothetical protein [Burkholderia]|uniref:hypothetical protein n=1 Tax=Burkholderia TaxID=32008 RepID=UPI0012699749|nr:MULTISPECIES: hypothetical protein [Burkholderia]
MTLDALRAPLDAILDICGGTLAADAVWNMLVLHLRWFPMSMLAMLMLLILREAERTDRRRRGTMRVLVVPPVRVALEAAAMLLVMALGMTAIKAVAFSLGMRWDTSGVAFAMLVSMLAFYALIDRAVPGRVSSAARS